MTHLLDKLDTVLVHLSKNKVHDGLSVVEIREQCLPDIDFETIEAILKHLEGLKLATSVCHEPKQGIGVAPLSGFCSYKISFEGLLFLEKTSFKRQNNIQKLSIAWMAAKTIISIIISFSIVIITYWTYVATDKANDNKQEVLKLNMVIDSLKTEIETLKHKK